MKILIISDDSAFINTIDSYFQKRGHSSIIYKWLIKAMDNLEEIKPEVIIVSADEYPRHWKSLVQFMDSGIAGNKFKIFLYKLQILSYILLCSHRYTIYHHVSPQPNLI